MEQGFCFLEGPVNGFGLLLSLICLSLSGRMSSNKSSHIPVIDLLRGVAASAVCLFHFICKTKAFITGPFILLIFGYGHYGVQLFFVISGMVIPLSMIKGHYEYKSFPRFLWKRFLRIEPPYLVAVLIGTAYLILRNHIPGTVPIDQTPSLRAFLLHIGYLIPFYDSNAWISPVFWTLAIEFQYYLLLALLFPLVLSPSVLARSIFYVVFLAGPFFGLSGEFLPVWMPLFLSGILYILWYAGKIKAIEYWLLTIPTLILIYWKIDGPTLVVAIGTIAAVHFFRTFSTAISRFFGDISYSLYLLHAIVGAAFVNYLSHHAHHAWQKALILLGGIGISILSAYFLNKFVEKPSQKLSSQVKY
jgi:peptidoglycan/LPS O-acetylase OafA/YrhL